ncbi:5'-3' exonuclease PLD3 [Ambystoma mexicanum]|uniref:5'-3' exonuclease PLD3 n=1 Tax=Ambystoma mexicanum TaxID=8296 RepID=UPI0037E7461F
MKPTIQYKKLKEIEDPDEVIISPTPQNSSGPMHYRCSVVVAFIFTFALYVVLSQLMTLPALFSTSTEETETVQYQNNTCSDPCQFVLVESIPEDLVYEANSTINPTTFQSWLDLLAMANSSVDIVSFYWTLTNEDTGTKSPTANQGEQILQELGNLSQRGITLRIAVDPPNSPQRENDINALKKAGADIRIVNMNNLTGGVLHTKFWVIDEQHLYIGSANMDWRALTQVKELGAAVYNCSCMALDLQKMFEAYWSLGTPGAVIPSPWPSNYSTTYNKDTPLDVALNGTSSQVYLSSAPPALCAEGRTNDLQSILSIIDDARHFVFISVMDYTPTMEYSFPKRYWPDIDDHLRKAVYERHVQVRLLISCWHNTNPSMFPFLRSLDYLKNNKSHYNISVKLFVVPVSTEQAKIPYARVNHNKYMVTDKVAYIGTSNWSGDYFLRTAGSALVVNQNSSATGQLTVQQQLKEVFERDWHSNYTRTLNSPNTGEDKCKIR